MLSTTSCACRDYTSWRENSGVMPGERAVGLRGVTIGCCFSARALGSLSGACCILHLLLGDHSGSCSNAPCASLCSWLICVYVAPFALAHPLPCFACASLAPAPADGRHFKHFYLVDASTGFERLAVVGEDSARQDRRYTYKAMEELGGFCFENGKAVSTAGLAWCCSAWGDCGCPVNPARDVDAWFGNIAHLQQGSASGFATGNPADTHVGCRPHTIQNGLRPDLQHRFIQPAPQPLYGLTPLPRTGVALCQCVHCRRSKAGNFAFWCAELFSCPPLTHCRRCKTGWTTSVAAARRPKHRCLLGGSLLSARGAGRSGELGAQQRTTQTRTLDPTQTNM